MPMHDWTKVNACIFQALHHYWISAICDLLNSGKLPAECYALPEQVAAGFGLDVRTIQGPSPDDGLDDGGGGVATATRLQTRPQTRFTAETEGEFYRRKKSSIAARHVSGDRIVAILEIVSPGNKSSENAIHSFLKKACELLEHRIHLLIVDPFPPGPHDPSGIHNLIWTEFQGEPFEPPADQPLTLVAYECEFTTRAYIEPFAVGQSLPDMPLFLEPHGCVMIPLEATYETAFSVLPRRWQVVLSPPASR